MKKYIILIPVMILICFSSCTQKNNSNEKITVCAVVNGENIMSDEIEYFKSRDRAEIVSQYAEKYGISDFSDFWERDFDGNSPSKALEDKAFSDAVEAKIKLVLMRDNGIYDDISFEALKKKAEQYNAEHKDKKGTVGINTVDLTSFYTYYISTGEEGLKNILAETVLKPSQEEIDSFPDKNSELTENGIISIIVSEKYDKLIKEKIGGAQIEIK